MLTIIFSYFSAYMHALQNLQIKICANVPISKKTQTAFNIAFREHTRLFREYQRLLLIEEEWTLLGVLDGPSFIVHNFAPRG